MASHRQQKSDISLPCADVSHPYRHIHTPWVNSILQSSFSLALRLWRIQIEEKHETKTDTNTCIRVCVRPGGPVWSCKPLGVDLAGLAAGVESSRALQGFREVQSGSWIPERLKRWLSLLGGVTQERHRLDLWPAWTLRQA